MAVVEDVSIKRIHVEKKEGFNIEARRLASDISSFLGAQYPELAKLGGIRILHRYDVAHLDKECFAKAVELVFSEPQCDHVYAGEEIPAAKGDSFFGIEYLPGQYDQRADSAEQCAALAVGIKPKVRTAKIIILENNGKGLSRESLEAVKGYLINPVDSREASLAMPESLEDEETTVPDIPVLDGFCGADDQALCAMAAEFSLAMSPEDLRFCRSYFAEINRDPTLAELRVLDTYWSDHCRHTTFTTSLEKIEIQEGPLAGRIRDALALYEKSREEIYGPDAGGRKTALMDLATIGVKVLKKRGAASGLDESKEINACSVSLLAEFENGGIEPWLLLFKNETHNHPTEIEPFGGAATCLGGAIRDPLSGRAYVHQAMRLSGGADPRAPLNRTLPGKLPQVKICREAAAGYSSYGNQIGLATGQVTELYHPGFAAKRMELGAVIAAVPEHWVRREDPLPGDVVVLVGGRTGRDGIGGATGSSKVHTGESVDSAGAEVQKGNPVEERKLQRLFRDIGVTRLIKRCNDFGAGGVSVAVGELAPGLDIDLDAVPKKYAGLNGIELAISESQERMAVVVAAEDAETLIRYASDENLEAVIIGRITAGEEEAESSEHRDRAAEAEIPEDARLRMFWRGKPIVDLSRAFLDTNGAPRSAEAFIAAEDNDIGSAETASSGEMLSAPALLDKLERELASLRSGSRRGLQERFDGSIGAGSVLFPWGGTEQGIPECGMAALLPSLGERSRTASLMCFGYDPELACRSPYEAAKGAVREAIAKFACLGGAPWTARLSLQEYFERCESPRSWGKPLAALLGALEAQLMLDIPAIGGKDSMSGTYTDKANGISLKVPPTLAAFAAGTVSAEEVISGALKGEPDNVLILLYQQRKDDIVSEWEQFKHNMYALNTLQKKKLVRAAYPVGPGGVAASLALMAFGNMTGVEAESGAFGLAENAVYQGSVLMEIDGKAFSDISFEIQSILNGAGNWVIAGRTLSKPVFRIVSGSTEVSEEDGNPDGSVSEIPLQVLRRAYEYPLAQVFPQTSAGITAAEGGDTAERLKLQLYTSRGRKKVRSVPAFNKGAAPQVVLPVFPGTNCEWDMERAFREAGGRSRLIIFRNRSPQEIAESTRELAEAIKDAHIVALSGGFSAGDEPDGSGKFIANVFRASAVQDAVDILLNKHDGLMLGICNGFQALIKLGLVPYGEYRTGTETMPTLTFNRIGRHVSRMVRTKVMSDKSPWLSLDETGSLHVIPVSHGEGRIVISDDEAEALFKNGQVPFCYTDSEGFPTMAEPDNPNGSAYAIEGLCSPDGRVLGKMGHSERCGEFVHINIPGSKKQRIFEAGIRYFS